MGGTILALEDLGQQGWRADPEFISDQTEFAELDPMSSALHVSDLGSTFPDHKSEGCLRKLCFVAMLGDYAARAAMKFPILRNVQRLVARLHDSEYYHQRSPFHRAGVAKCLFFET